MKILHNINEVNKELEKDFVIVVAKTHTCSVCSTTNNLLNNNIKGIENIDVVNVYVDDVDEFRGQHTIFTVPTVLVFSNGKELLRESRFINYDKINRLVDLYTS